MIITAQVADRCKVCGIPTRVGEQVGWMPKKRGVWCLKCCPPDVKLVGSRSSIANPVAPPTIPKRTAAADTDLDDEGVVVAPDEEDTPPPPPKRPFLVLDTFRSKSRPGEAYDIRLDRTVNQVYCQCTGYNTHGYCWHMETFLRKNSKHVPTRVEAQQRYRRPARPVQPTSFDVDDVDLSAHVKPLPPNPFSSPTGRTTTAPPLQNVPPFQSDRTHSARVKDADDAKRKRVNDLLDAFKKAQTGTSPPPVVPPAYPPVGRPGRFTGEMWFDPNGTAWQWVAFSNQWVMHTFDDPPPPPPPPPPTRAPTPPSWFKVMDAMEELVIDMATKGLTPEMEKAWERYQKLKASALSPGSANEGRMALKLALVKIIEVAFS